MQKRGSLGLVQQPRIKVQHLVAATEVHLTFRRRTAGSGSSTAKKKEYILGAKDMSKNFEVSCYYMLLYQYHLVVVGKSAAMWAFVSATFVATVVHRDVPFRGGSKSIGCRSFLLTIPGRETHLQCGIEYQKI